MTELFTDLRKKLLSGKRNDTVTLIRDALAQKISQEQENFELPRIYQLAEELRVSNQSVRKAYSLLSDAGLIERPAGSKLWKCVKHRSSKVFAVIIPEPFLSFIRLNNLNFQYRMMMFSGLIDRANELGFTVAPITLPPPDADDETIADTLKELRTNYRGIIHIGTRGMDNDRPLAALLKDRSIPQITFACQAVGADIPSVRVDWEQTIASIIHYLRSFNHHRFAVLWSYSSRQNAIDHNLSITSPIISSDYIKSCFEKNRETSVQPVYCPIEHSGNFNNNFIKTIQNVFNVPNRPTAIWCSQVVLAYRAINILRDMGLRVPEDVSVMSFGDRLDAPHSTPPLSTMRCQHYESGRAVIDHLMLMEKYPGDQIPDKLMSTILADRGSVTGYSIKDIYDDFGMEENL
ncbi:MAG: GntR family transcriptional regulator [Lentisphaerae bacterium]|nr:GntR family transcriptional regulator [Lentisphaerota bacterium]